MAVPSVDSFMHFGILYPCAGCRARVSSNVLSSSSPVLLSLFLSFLPLPRPLYAPARARSLSRCLVLALVCTLLRVRFARSR